MQYSAQPVWLLLAGLALFGLIFAVNSSIHSFLIVSYANRDGTSLDVGFYYMANAAGRLLGTVLSGWVFLQGGLVWCLLISSLMLLIAGSLSLKLPRS
jgi:predicted MFS family arabinose efflux permease